jgi:hypothetical protein
VESGPRLQYTYNPRKILERVGDLLCNVRIQRIKARMLNTLAHGYGGGEAKKAERAEYILDKVVHGFVAYKFLRNKSSDCNIA